MWVLATIYSAAVYWSFIKLLWLALIGLQSARTNVLLCLCALLRNERVWYNVHWKSELSSKPINMLKTFHEARQRTNHVMPLEHNYSPGEAGWAHSPQKTLFILIGGIYSPDTARAVSEDALFVLGKRMPTGWVRWVEDGSSSWAHFQYRQSRPGCVRRSARDARGIKTSASASSASAHLQELTI